MFFVSFTAIKIASKIYSTLNFIKNAHFAEEICSLPKVANNTYQRYFTTKILNLAGLVSMPAEQSKKKLFVFVVPSLDQNPGIKPKTAKKSAKVLPLATVFPFEKQLKLFIQVRAHTHTVGGQNFKK